MFITVEGIDGSGKSTAVEIIADHLRDHYQQDPLVTSELNNTLFGRDVKRLLPWEVDPAAELYLILAARAEQIQSVILPAVADNKTVICDRYLHSSIAYQGHGRGLSVSDIINAHVAMKPFPIPDLVLVLDVSPSTAQERMRARGEKDGFDKLGPAFFERVRLGFKDPAGKRLVKQHMTIVNESITIEQLRSMLIACLDSYLSQRNLKRAANDG